MYGDEEQCRDHFSSVVLIEAAIEAGGEKFSLDDITQPDPAHPNGSAQVQWDEGLLSLDRRLCLFGLKCSSPTDPVTEPDLLELCRHALHYALRLKMVSPIRHKGLKRLYEDDDPRGVMAEHVDKLRDILARLDAARAVTDMDIPGLRLHRLKGEMKGMWAVTVRANWESFFVFKILTRSMLTIWTTTEMEHEQCR